MDQASEHHISEGQPTFDRNDSSRSKAGEIDYTLPSTSLISREHTPSLPIVERELTNKTDHDNHQATKSLPSTSSNFESLSASETTNTTSNKDDSFMSVRLAREIEKAQKSLENPDVSETEAEDERSCSRGNSADQPHHQDTPANHKRSIVPPLSADGRSLRTRVDSSATSPGTDLKAHSHSPKTSTIDTSTNLASCSNPQSSPRPEEGADSTTIPTMKIIRLPDQNNEIRETNIRNHHKRPSSPEIASPSRNVRSRSENPTSTSLQSKELFSEKKPLAASNALPVYSKLIAALEEARLSDCLTTPMAKELKSFTFRCKKAGTAILKKEPLPPEDEVIIILDDDDVDLATKYGVSLDFFVSPDHESNGSQEEAALFRGTSQNAPSLHTENFSLTTENFIKEKNEQSEEFETAGLVRQISVVNEPPSHLIAQQPEQPTKLTNSQHHQDDCEPHKGVLESTPLASQSSQSDDHINETSAIIGLLTPKKKIESSIFASQSTQSENDSTMIGPLAQKETIGASLKAPQSTQSEDLITKTGVIIDPLTQELIVETSLITSQTTQLEDQNEETSTINDQRTQDQTEETSTINNQQTQDQDVAKTPPVPQSAHTDDQSKDPGTIIRQDRAKHQPPNTRELRVRKKVNVDGVISRYSDSNSTHRTPTGEKRVSRTASVKDKVTEGEGDDNVVAKKKTEDPERSESAAPVKFFLGSAVVEKELKDLLSPYCSNQTPKRAKIVAWEALRSLLNRRRLGEPLDQVFLDSIEGGTDSVLIKTKFNAQTWFEAIELTMPNLFNSHAGEPAYALGFFNTSLVKNESLADRVPQGVPAFWHHTWRTMRMCIRPSPTRVSSFLKILLDSVLLTGRTFLKEPPISEQEKAMTGIEAVCQAMKWLNSQRSSRANTAKTIRLLDLNNQDSLIDVSVIQQWQDLFIKVLDAYVVQYFEANYILNEKASVEDKAAATKFKKEWKGDSIKSPTLGYLTLFACCGIRGLICCSNDVNVTPAGQMLSFAVLSEWLCRQRPGFQVKEPIFKRSNQLLMKLIDGLFDKDGHFVKPEMTWYDLAKNLCFDYLSNWFMEGGELAEGSTLVFPKSSVFSGVEKAIKFSKDN